MEVREPSAKYLRSAGYVQTELGVLPTDWRIAEIGQIAETSSGTTPPRSQYDRYFNGGVHAWVKTLDLNNAHIRETDESVTDNAIEETSLRLFPEGSVLVAMYGGLRQIGRTGLLRLPAAVNQAITAIRPNPTVFCPDFLLFYLNHRVGHWQSVASSSRKDPNITGADVRAFKLPLPEIDEQQKIAAALTDADALIDSLEQLLTKKRQIKQGSMQELLTGKRRLPGFAGLVQTVQLGSVCKMQSGGTPAASQSAYFDGPHPWVAISDITQANKYLSTTERSLSDAGLNACAAQLFPAGTILYAMYASVGECCIATVTSCTSQAILAMQPTNRLDSEYLYYSLVSSKARAKSAVQQGTQGNLNKGIVQAMDIRLPEIAEQQAIARVLSEMDTELTALESRLTKARALKQAMAQALLTGRIRLVPGSAA